MKEYRTILDVRSEGEYANDGHVTESVNIPIDQIQDRIEEIKALETPICVCCKSGGRSKVATQYLVENEGLDCFNGGGWQDVQEGIESGELSQKN